MSVDHNAACLRRPMIPAIHCDVPEHCVVKRRQKPATVVASDGFDYHLMARLFRQRRVSKIGTLVMALHTMKPFNFLCGDYGIIGGERTADVWWTT